MVIVNQLTLVVITMVVINYYKSTLVVCTNGKWMSKGHILVVMVGQYKSPMVRLVNMLTSIMLKHR